MRIDVALVALLVACAGQQPQQSVQPTPAAARVPNADLGPETQPAPQPAVRVNPFNDPDNILSKRSIYCGYDKFDLKPEFRPSLEAHAKYLRDHLSANIKI